MRRELQFESTAVDTEDGGTYPTRESWNKRLMARRNWIIHEQVATECTATLISRHKIQALPEF